MANEERKKGHQRNSMSGAKDEPVAHVAKGLEYKTHDNTGHSRFNHQDIINSDPKLSEFSVVKKNKGQQLQQQSQPQPHQPPQSSSSASHYYSQNNAASHDPTMHQPKRNRPN
jgi:hypothetical protein